MRIGLGREGERGEDKKEKGRRKERGYGGGEKKKGASIGRGR